MGDHLLQHARELARELKPLPADFVPAPAVEEPSPEPSLDATAAATAGEDVERPPTQPPRAVKFATAAAGTSGDAVQPPAPKRIAERRASFQHLRMHAQTVKKTLNLFNTIKHARKGSLRTHSHENVARRRLFRE